MNNRSCREWALLKGGQSWGFGYIDTRHRMIRSVTALVTCIDAGRYAVAIDRSKRAVLESSTLHEAMHMGRKLAQRWAEDRDPWK